MATENVPVLVRMDPDLHDRVGQYAEAHHCSRNAAVQALIEQGLLLSDARLLMHASGALERVGA